MSAVVVGGKGGGVSTSVVGPDVCVFVCDGFEVVDVVFVGRVDGFDPVAGGTMGFDCGTLGFDGGCDPASEVCITSGSVTSDFDGNSSGMITEKRLLITQPTMAYATHRRCTGAPG